MRRVTNAVLMLGLCCCSTDILQAQSTNASVTGYVTDPTKAVITDAKVIAINVGTNARYEGLTNKTGSYTISTLPPGVYRLEVEKTGFKTVVKSDVVLHVQDAVAINFEMALGSTSETVTVESGAPLVNTESAAVSTVVDREFVENLPLNGRSFQTLIQLTPGVVLTKAGVTEQGQFSVNGQRPDANYFTIDGVGANIGASPNATVGQAAGGSLPGFSATGGTNNLVSIDALLEFKVQTSSYAPEFGRTPGAQVSIVTRSGTNAFHGTMFEYLRNDVFDATDFFANSRGLKKPALRQNDFGGVFGGPVLLPRLGGDQPWYDGRNRTFFFFSYEGQRLRLPTVGITDVPSLAARADAPAPLRPFLDAFPRQTGPDKIGTNGLPTGFAEFAASFSNSSNLDATSIRIDHTAGNRVTLFGRYSDSPSESIQRGPVGIRSLSSVTGLEVTTHTATTGATFLVASNVTDDLRFNYSRNVADVAVTLDGFGGATAPGDSVLFPAFASRQDSEILFILGSGSLALFAGRSNLNLQSQINVVDSISILSGTHAFKFGADYRRLTPSLSGVKYAQTVVFNGIGITAPPTAAPSGTVLSGKASFATIIAQAPPRSPVLTNLSLYGQDIWKINGRLTLTYGIRYEVNPAPSEANGNDPFTLQQVNDPATFALAPRGTRLYNSTYNNFAPRVGVAYHLFQRSRFATLLRGGFGIFYDLGTGSILNAFGSFFPFTASKLAPGSFTPDGVPFPLSAATASPPPIVFGPPVTGSFFVADPNLKLPYTLQWNLAVEQSLGSNQTLSATYIGSAGRRLLRQELLAGAILTGNPTFAPGATLFITRNVATSDYHALQIQFQRRLSRGLQAVASYAWSHSIDSASNDSSQGSSTALRIDPLIDRGPSDFDVRHAFSAGVTYNLPAIAKGAVARSVLRGWSLDSFATSRSALPVDITFRRDIGFGTVTLRPALVAGVPLFITSSSFPGGEVINNTPVPGNPRQIGPFLLQADARQGTLGRNALRGFPLNQIDVAVRRRFNLTERIGLQFRAEFFNLLNHPNFANPDGNLGTASSTTGLLTSPNSFFGQSISMLSSSLGAGGTTGGLSPLYQVGGPRSIQLSLKLQF